MKPTSTLHPPIPESDLTEDIAALKAQHPGLQLYRARVTLALGQGTVTLFYRQPTYADAEAYTAKQQQEQQQPQPDTLAANINLCSALVVGPESKAAAAELAKWPFALNRWVERSIMPFFGGGAQVENTSL